MSQFVVNYESEQGESEIFGVFNSYEDAVAWMNKDATEIINTLSVDYHLEHHGETRIEIENYGYWMVQEITPVN